MDVNNVVFVWKSFDENDLGFTNVKKVEIAFDDKMENPIVGIDAGMIKIEDRTFDIDSKDVLKKIKKLINDEEVDKYEIKEYTPNSWELYVDDNKYEGIFEYPSFVAKVKKIIKLDIILMMVNKKIANYTKN